MVWLMNIPMLWLGFRYLGRWVFLGKTLLAVTIFSFSSDFFLHWLPHQVERWPLTDNVLLAAIYAGVVGGYSGTGRSVVLCTVHRPQVALLKDLVHQVDQEAFLTIGVSHQAYGGGFNSQRRAS